MKNGTWDDIYIQNIKNDLRNAPDHEMQATHEGKRYQLQRGIFGNPDTYIFLSLDDVKREGMYFYEGDTWSSGISLNALREATQTKFGIDLTTLNWQPKK